MKPGACSNMRCSRCISSAWLCARRMAAVVSTAEQKMPPIAPLSSSSGVYEKLK